MIRLARGFTLIELLIVIVIIGILAVTLVPKLKGMKDQAKTVQIAADFRNIEQALLLTLADENRSSFWTESEIGLGGNPTFAAIYAKTSGPMSTFSNHIGSISNNPFDASQPYRYDNDGEVSAPDCDGWAPGVNILFYGFGNDQTRIDRFDRYIDGTLSSYCGRFRYFTNNITGDGGYHVFAKP